MRVTVRLWIALVSVACLAQTPDPNQKLLEELKGVRATLDRLAQVADTMERNQRALMVLVQMQLYKSEMNALQSRKETLDARERELGARVSALGESARMADSGIGPTGAPPVSGTTNTNPRTDVSERLAAATRLLNENRARQESVDREIATLRARLAQVEKAMEGLLPK